jgi:hypothetical protein
VGSTLTLDMAEFLSRDWEPAAAEVGRALDEISRLKIAVAYAKGFLESRAIAHEEGFAAAVEKLAALAEGDRGEPPMDRKVPEDESLARLIAVKLGFKMDTFPDMHLNLTKSDCFRAADAILAAGYRRQ